MIILSTTTFKNYLNLTKLTLKMADNPISLPGGYGGLTRFSEEYESRFNLKPTHIIVMIVLIILFRISLGFIYG